MAIIINFLLERQHYNECTFLLNLPISSPPLPQRSVSVCCLVQNLKVSFEILEVVKVSSS